MDKIRDQYLHILLKLGINEDMERHINKKRSFDFIEFINLPNKIKQELLEENNENIVSIVLTIEYLLSDDDKKVIFSSGIFSKE